MGLGGLRAIGEGRLARRACCSKRRLPHRFQPPAQGFALFVRPGRAHMEGHAPIRLHATLLPISKAPLGALV